MARSNQTARMGKSKKCIAKPPESDSQNSSDEYQQMQADAQYFHEKVGDSDDDVNVINDSSKRPQATGEALNRGSYSSTTFNSSGKIGFKPHKSAISKQDKPDKYEKFQRKRDRKNQNRKQRQSVDELDDDEDFWKKAMSNQQKIQLP